MFKRKEDGHYKAQLDAKGYSQNVGIDFHKTFVPVVKFTTLQTLLALLLKNNWEIEGTDVKTAFLHGKLVELIFVDIPDGLKQQSHYNSGISPRQACRLVNTIYGLKQSPRGWYEKIDIYYSKTGFARSKEDHSLYIHGTRKLIKQRI